MDKIMTEVATKLGGFLAVAGLLIGGFLWYPKCDASAFADECRNAFGSVPLNNLGQPNIEGLVATGSLIGAVVGGVLGLLIAAIWPSAKKNLGLG